MIPQKAQTGFARTATVVVVATIALIAALLVSIRNARNTQGSRNTICESHLKSLAFAFSQYAADNDNCIPPYSNRWEPPVGTKSKWYITDKFGRVPRPNQPRPDMLVKVLSPYLHSQDVWFCPSDPLKGRPNTNGLNIMGLVMADHRYCTYVTPQTFANYPTTLNGFEAKDKGRTIILTKPGDSVICEEYITVNPHQTWLAGLIPSGPRHAPALYTHMGKVNSISFDGHLKKSEPNIY